MDSFVVKDCALIPIATGIKARNLSELRDRLTIVPHNALYYHFWGGRLRTTHEHDEYQNDFSHWAYDCLHDQVLSERLELVNPSDFDDFEHLRQELLEIVTTRLEECEEVSIVVARDPFYFLTSKIIVFYTRHIINNPKELMNVMSAISPSSLFYHFIDSSKRVMGKTDDFTAWLANAGTSYEELVQEMKKIDPYFLSLHELQERLLSIFMSFFVQDEGGAHDISS